MDTTDCVAEGRVKSSKYRTSHLNAYVMSSALLVPLAAKPADHMKRGRLSSFRINWRVTIGIFLAFTVVSVYYLSTPSAMASRGYLEWEGNDNGIFYREDAPANGGRFTVLFLHGQAFSSQTWDDLGTLKFLSSHDYRVVAVDLPGFVKSKDAEQPRTSEGRSVFLKKFIEKLKIDRPVLVSPSMSGSYALPFIFQGDQGKHLRGYVPVAPVGTDKYEESDYKSLQLPTLIFYGENDSTLGVSSLRRLRNIPDSVIHMMKDAGHACYMANPEEFHEKLLSFLNKL